MDANELIRTYYNIKGKYISKYTSSKNKILKSDSSLYEKKIRLKKLQMKCINCKRNVGTIFNRSNNILMCRCGDSENPCNLNIQIDVGQHQNINNLLETIDEDMENAKQFIINIKLKFLYNLICEEEIEKTFNSIKNTFKSLKNANNNILEQIENNNKVEIDEPLPKKVDRTTLKKINEIKIGNLINNFKKLIQDYQKEDKALEKQSIMSDALDLYSTQILPLFKNQRSIVHKINTVIEDKNMFYLVQIKNYLKDNELVLDELNIISNKK